MWSLLRTPRWQGFTALVIIAIIAFGLLSAWQWSRAEEERQARLAQITQTEQTRVTVDIGLASLGEPLPDDLRVPVSTTGVYVADSTVLVRQRPLDGRNGFWVATLFDLDTGGDIWVNRGWIPATGAATAVIDPPPPPNGNVEVEGWLVPSEVTREEITDLPDGQVRWLDTARLRGDPPLPVYLERVNSLPADSQVLALPLPEVDETQNISYAIQWLVFAAIALSGWVFFLRREAREDAAARQAAS
jgi:cytochrome oxidase assembly protein ShyY1